MIFPESATAHKYLDGLQGIEIGGAAHNPFGLNTLNVDKHESMDTIYKNAEFRICDNKLKVDVVAPGDCLPFKDKEFDFVVSSHVIEHFFDPIKALKEWQRVAKQYIFIICPHKQRTFDHTRPITQLSELISRHEGKLSPEMYVDNSPDHHWNVWDTFTFLNLCNYLGLNVIEYLDKDDKVGNGFLVVIKI